MAYVANDPLNRVDPSGMQGDCSTIGASTCYAYYPNGQQAKGGIQNRQSSTPVRKSNFTPSSSFDPYSHQTGETVGTSGILDESQTKDFAFADRMLRSDMGRAAFVLGAIVNRETKFLVTVNGDEFGSMGADAPIYYSSMIIGHRDGVNNSFLSSLPSSAIILLDVHTHGRWSSTVVPGPSPADRTRAQIFDHISAVIGMTGTIWYESKTYSQSRSGSIFDD